MLAGVVAGAPADRLSHHSYGISDPEGFAAMGVVETAVHAHDVTTTLGLPWQLPADLCERVIDRLFPGLPEHPDPWERLLWATGRLALPDHPARESWRWDGRPVALARITWSHADRTANPASGATVTSAVDGQPLTTFDLAFWKDGGVFSLDGRPYEVRGNFWRTRSTLVDEMGGELAAADRVGRKRWTVTSAGQTYGSAAPHSWSNRQDLYSATARSVP